MGGSSLRDRLQLGFGRPASEVPIGPPKLLAASLRFKTASPRVQGHGWLISAFSTQFSGVLAHKSPSARVWSHRIQICMRGLFESGLGSRLSLHELVPYHP